MQLAHYATDAVRPVGAAPGLAARAGALALAGALGLAVFYHGPQVALLAGVQLLLIVWLAAALAAAGTRAGVSIPLTPVSVTLALFWLWLGVSLAWSRVPGTSIVGFWWVGSFALVFWAYTLTPGRETVWRLLARAAPAGALALGAYALVQVLAWGEPPRATFLNIHSFAALLMLVALPVSARFLGAPPAAPARARCAPGALLFVFCFVIALTEGRGTTLSTAFGLALLVLLARPVTRGRSRWTLVALALGAYVLASLMLHGSLSGTRLATLADPASAGSPRFLIWRGSWELLMQQPWWGIGLGTYYLAWPPFRDPADSSLGFFVHNDYLQLWIEAGLPALLLLLAVFVSVPVMLARALRAGALGREARLEAAGLFAGLCAVAAHSLLDFNFYILPISIAAGLALARFHELTAGPGTRVLALRPARLMSSGAWRLVIALLALFPLSYLVALGLGDHLYKRGFALALRGELQQAERAFQRAERLVPGDDKVLVMHADLYRHALAQLHGASREERRALFERALDLLRRAEAANPYGALIHAVRGRLCDENRDLAGDAWRARVAEAYQAALARDPRYFPARLAYADVLLAAGRPERALDVLAGGIEHWYHPSESVLAYYRRTAALARVLGDDGRARELERRIRAAQAAAERLAPVRPVAPELSLPTPRG